MQCSIDASEGRMLRDLQTPVENLCCESPPPKRHAPCHTHDSLPITSGFDFRIFSPMAVDRFLPGTDGSIVPSGDEKIACIFR